MIIREPDPELLTTSERELRCWVVTGNELAAGDVLIFLGEEHRIDRLTPAGPNATLEQVYPEGGVRLIWTGGREFSWAAPSQMYRILPRVPLPVDLDKPEAVAAELRRLGLPVHREHDVIGHDYAEVFAVARRGGWVSPDRPRAQHVNRGRLTAELEESR